MGKRGPVARTIYTRAFRIRLTEARAALLPFFQQLEQLPRGARDDVLLDAIQHGVAQAHEMLARKQHIQSARVERAIENILDGF